MHNLIPCPECQRHVRPTETTCPFCAGSIGARVSATSARAFPTMRLSRAALYAFAAASVGTAACGGSTEPGPASTDGGVDGSAHTGGQGNGTGGNAASGGQTNTGGNGTGGASTGGQTNSGGMIIAPPYGVPPPPTGGSGGDIAVPHYGAPPPTGGAGGTIVAPYGAPPPFTGGNSNGGDVPMTIYGAPAATAGPKEAPTE